MKGRERRDVQAVVIGLSLIGWVWNSAAADETHAREILLAMSDHLAGSQELSFDYDATLEVVTVENEKLGLARSGTVSIARPDKLHASRLGGFSDLEVLFDGNNLSFLGNHLGVYATVPQTGGIDALVDALRDEHGRPLPAADLLGSNPYEALMSEVSEIKDLGSGFVGGRECDHLAFRSADVDWQVWIAVEDPPLPCRFTVTARDVSQAPQYTVAFLNWRNEVPEAFEFAPPDGAQAVSLQDYSDQVAEYPSHITLGEDG